MQSVVARATRHAKASHHELVGPARSPGSSLIAHEPQVRGDPPHLA